MLRLFASKRSDERPATSSSDRNSSFTSDTSVEDQFVVNGCRCCGTLVKFPSAVTKYRCSVCRSTLCLVDSTHRESSSDPISLEEVRRLIQLGQKKVQEKGPSHAAFEELETYLSDKFGSITSLNGSFQVPTTHSKNEDRIPAIDYQAIHDLFGLVTTKVPTKRPYLKLLAAVDDLLRRPTKPMTTPQDIRWVLIALEIPTLRTCLHTTRRTPQSRLDTPEISAFSYDILKRVIGYLATSDYKTLGSITKWLGSLTPIQYEEKVQLVNLYISFHFIRAININFNSSGRANKNTIQPESPSYNEFNSSQKIGTRPPPEETPSTMGHNITQSLQTGFTSWGEWTRSLAAPDPKPSDFKLKVAHYGHDWHIRTAARLLSVLFIANRDRIPVYCFYNTLSDYIYVRNDFEIWQSTFCKRSTSEHQIQRQLYQEIFNYGSHATAPQFTFCQYPFLLSLGCKISMMEYEARRTMEMKAEEAFIKSLDSRRAVDLHLIVQVRRSHITNDSLRCIKRNRQGLKKALKVEFIGEPGIDAGGLKKEWFQLLVRELFLQDNGMFFYNEESHMCWFCPTPLEKNTELFYLVGVILGLAIYNSTILDLKFPLALYKKLLGKRVSFDDYMELFPSTGKGLVKLMKLTEEEFDAVEVYYETTFKDLLGTTVVKELVPGGSSIRVTKKNCRDYVNKWVDFYMNSSVDLQFQSFYTGFHNVIGGNALTLFAPVELQMVICGNNETKIDTESFKAITKYVGWFGPFCLTNGIANNKAAEDASIVKWFWEWFEDLDTEKQKRFLTFVTGSDRIPATGVSTMTFKLTKLPTYGKNKTARLPVAHTCFNELCVYDYTSKEEFWGKLDISICESEGFGLR